MLKRKKPKKKKNEEIILALTMLNNMAMEEGYIVRNVNWSKFGLNSVYVTYQLDIIEHFVTVIVRISNHLGGVLSTYDMSCLIKRDGTIENFEEVQATLRAVKKHYRKLLKSKNKDKI